MTTSTRTAELRTAALDTAARGWPVFPCAPGAKRPAVKAWNTRATTDPDRIAACWNSGQPFNIGIACGPAGLVVLDADTAGPDEAHPDGRLTPDGWTGLDALAELAAAARARGVHASTGGVPATYTVATPSGGRHLYFGVASDREFRNTAGAVGWKLDSRAAGGYVLAAGSRLPHGAYRAVPDASGAVSALPEWLAAALAPAARPAAPARPVAPARLGGPDRQGRYLDAAISAETARVTTARGGTRNRALYIAAVALGQLAAGGALDDDQVRAALLDAAAGHIANGAFSAGQAHATITSGLRAGARRPRRLAPENDEGAVA